jgi:uroporphyrinogen-III synthase
MASAVLAGRSVVITRPAEQTSDLQLLLERAGAHVRSRPLVRIGPPRDAHDFGDALNSLEQFDWIVFTSANAVRACVEAGPVHAKWPRCACVGSSTAAAAEAAGIPVTFVPDEFTAEGLADAWPVSGLQGARILWPRASGARTVLAERLRAAGAMVRACEAYQTIVDGAAAMALHDELKQEPPDVLLFTSSSAVRAYASAGVAPRETVIGVIGPVTADAAVRAGVKVHVVPVQHTAAALVHALEAYFSEGQRPEAATRVP